jgi:hypothetical protein
MAEASDSCVSTRYATRVALTNGQVLTTMGKAGAPVPPAAEELARMAMPTSTAINTENKGPLRNADIVGNDCMGGKLQPLLLQPRGACSCPRTPWTRGMERQLRHNSLVIIITSREGCSGAVHWPVLFCYILPHPPYPKKGGGGGQRKRRRGGLPAKQRGS